jgi:Trp operon repressor
MQSKWLHEKAREKLAQFLGTVASADMEALLNDLMTPQEMMELVERIHLFRQLKDGKTQRAIAEDMGISVTTVNRGSRVLQFGTGVIEKYV